jgi:tetraacyldisaccharide 4'-kinase
MRAPEFWSREASLQASALAPLSWVWGVVAARRMLRHPPAAPVPAICVGNFVVGGAGKTPVAALLCELLAQSGLSAAILSRGYGGSATRTAPLRVDPALHDARDVGDEPLLLARRALVIVGADRAAAAGLAHREGAQALVLDDGFQSAALAAAALVVVDGSFGLGNGRVLPAGPLRAPMAAQWTCASALLVLGEGEPGRRLARQAEQRGLPTFRGRLAPDPAAVEELAGRRALAFAGIGRPEKFFATLEQCGVRVVARRPFADHYAFAKKDVVGLFDAGRKLGADILVTTEKDMTRLERLRAELPAVEAIRVLPIEVKLDDEAGFASWVSSALTRQLRNDGPRQA